MRIASFDVPLAAAWRLTDRCDLSCRHCLNASGPKADTAAELSRPEALKLARSIGSAQVPYVILCGGEPMLSPDFWQAAETLGEAGAWLKVETHGQNLGRTQAERLAKLPIRSVQVSLDGVTQQAYESLRPGASLAKTLEACREVRRQGMPLEISFVPVQGNIHEAPAVIDLALDLGAFRFNTGTLIKRGRAAAAWKKLLPDAESMAGLLAVLTRREATLAGRLELCFRPFNFEDQVRAERAEPSGTLTILPDGKVPVSASSDVVCADLRTQTVREAWRAYLAAHGKGPRSERWVGSCLEPATRS
ncbi:MAG: radical SAM protein [Elusimicrobia bacterium]|nr:radical SAM protein [Elusimicrobiota bacterium]